MGCIYFETVLNDFVSKLVVTQNIFSFLFKVFILELVSLTSLLGYSQSRLPDLSTGEALHSCHVVDTDTHWVSNRARFIA